MNFTSACGRARHCITQINAHTHTLARPTPNAINKLCANYRLHTGAVRLAIWRWPGGAVVCSAAPEREVRSERRCAVVKECVCGVANMTRIMGTLCNGRARTIYVIRAGPGILHDIVRTHTYTTHFERARHREWPGGSVHSLRVHFSRLFAEHLCNAYCACVCVHRSQN